MESVSYAQSSAALIKIIHPAMRDDRGEAPVQDVHIVRYMATSSATGL
jgi:hypothetical protein